MPSRIFSGRSDRPDWNKVGLLERNRQPGQAYLVQYPDFETCANALEHNRRYLSPFVHMLDGRWDFKLFDSILQMPDNILAYRSGFDSIEVPAVFDITRAISRRQTVGREGDWPFPLNPPFVPDNIPVGVYHRSIQLPPAWNGVRKRIVIHAARSAFHVVVNGRIAGFAQSGQLTQAFDLTTHMHDGVNELFILMYSFSAGSYLDGFGNPFRPGLLSDVYLEAIAPVSVFDWMIETHPVQRDHAGPWQLNVSAKILSFKFSAEKIRVRITLAKENRILLVQETTVDPGPESHAGNEPTVQRMHQARFCFEPSNVLPWSDESPELYDLFLTCLDTSGREISCVHQAFGFRHCEFSDGKFLLNGQPVKLVGVDFQPHLEALSGVWSLASLVRDLRMIKQQHFNTIHLTDGPVDPMVFEICDTLGIYVISGLAIKPWPAWTRAAAKGTVETAMDSHWQQHWKDRITRQILRDRSRTCLIAWQVPATDSHTMNLESMIHETDPARGTVRFLNRADDAPITDSACPQLNLPDNRLSLYGGGSADLEDSLNQALTEDKWAGIRCGDWQEVRALLHSRHGRALVASLDLVRAQARPLSYAGLDLSQGAFLVTNKQQFLDLSGLRLYWQMMRNGLMAVAGELDLPAVLPGETLPIAIDFGPVDFNTGDRYSLHLTTHLVAGNLCLPPDAVVAIDHFEIGENAGQADPFLSTLAPALPQSVGRIRVEEDRHLLVLSGTRFWLVFNRVTGMLESWRCNDHELLAFAQSTVAPQRGQFGSPLVFWRPVLPEDLPMKSEWLELGLDRLVQTIDHVNHSCDGTRAEIVVSSRYGANGMVPVLGATVTYRVDRLGQMTIQTAVNWLQDNSSSLPRLGFRLQLRRQYERITWSGQGPQPSWPDCAPAIFTGQFSQMLDDVSAGLSSTAHELSPHAQTEWVACSDEHGFGLLVTSESPFSFQTRNFLLEDLLEHPADPGRLHHNLLELILDWHLLPAGSQNLPEEAHKPAKMVSQFHLAPRIGFAKA
jgi:beta-galactosidase/beta-glucuronidase